MKYYIIAGEASGDLHGSNLIKALRQQDNNAQIRCWGGDLMEQAGGQLVKHYRDLAFMGFVEVIKNLPTIWRNFRECKADIQQFEPDALLLIDYPGFNLRMAQWAKKNGYRVFYYISPQVWAWKSGRVKQMKRDIEHLFVILPFEEAYFKQQWQWQSVTFVGHPLLDALDLKHTTPLSADVLGLPSDDDNRPIIALLPGSRRQEIAQMLPQMLAIVPFFPQYRFVVAGAPAIPAELYRHFLDIAGNSVFLCRNQTHELLSMATAAIVTSGTATLETALFGVPQVVCYKGNPISYQLARYWIKVRYISLVNLILDRPAVCELIQHELTTERLKNELQAILPPMDNHYHYHYHHPNNDGDATASNISDSNTNSRQRLLDDYRQLHQLLGGGGASERTAEAIQKLCEQQI